jgi:hypothetical protein
MIRAEQHRHDGPRAAVLEQLTRWAIADGWGGRGPTAYAARAVQAASKGDSDGFRAAVANLAAHDGPSSRAAMLHAVLCGETDVTPDALAGNDGLCSLYRTAAGRDVGVDVAEITTSHGLRLRAEYTGAAYQTTVLVEDTPGRSDVLASGTVLASSATQALWIAAKREHAVQGLDRTDVAMVHHQIVRLDQLTGLTLEPAGQGPGEPGDRWAATVTRVTGRDLRSEPGWPALAATLDSAASAGWDVQRRLPAVADSAPPLTHGWASQELAHRVMRACPDAVPAERRTAQVSPAEPTTTGQQREAAEYAATRRRSPERGPMVGR